MSGTETAIPKHPSNRRIIEQMRLWGWAVGKQNGKWQQMLGPPVGDMKGVTIAVKPASQHDANPTDVFLEIYRITTAGDAEAFWDGPPDQQAWDDMLAQAWKREKARREQDQADALSRAAENAQRLAVQHRAEKRRQERLAEAAKQTPNVSRETSAKPITKKPTTKKESMIPERRLINIDPAKVRLRSSDVLQVLVTKDRPMNHTALLKELNLEDNAQNRSDVSGRCCYLASKGLAVRVMAGTYRAAPDAHAIAARISHDVHSDQPQTAAHSDPAPAVRQVVESIDDTIEAVLDLLLPHGFRAADLRFIAPWVETTKTMVEEVSKHQEAG